MVASHGNIVTMAAMQIVYKLFVQSDAHIHHRCQETHNNKIALKCKTLGVVDVNALCACSKKLIIGLGPAMLLIRMRTA